MQPQDAEVSESSQCQGSARKELSEHNAFCSWILFWDEEGRLDAVASLAASQVMAVTRQAGSQCETVFRNTGEELHLQCMVLLNHKYRKIHTKVR